MKAILELEMPNACSECPFWGEYKMCSVISFADPGVEHKGYLYPNTQRADYCSLKTVKEDRSQFAANAVE
jgi:hypothetical protein